MSLHADVEQGYEECPCGELIYDDEPAMASGKCPGCEELLFWRRFSDNDKNETEVSESEALRTPPTPEGAGIRAGDLL